MAKNKSNTYQSTKSPGNFESNKPNYSKPTGGKGQYILDSSGKPVSPVQPPLEGEIIELQKRHYGQSNINELLDRGFSEITKTKEKISPNNFFNLYQELFYDIPKQGKRSHTFLIEESTKYIGGYEDPKEDKIQNLLDKIVDLETSMIQTPTEHPLFRNGTAIRAGGKLGIMQEGKLRGVSNQGDPSPFTQLKKTLGITDADGKPLTGEDSWTRVTEQTWDSLPKWPPGTEINQSADWSLSLSQFNKAASNITVLTENIKISELGQAEINFLISELQSKTPFEGITLEDSLAGNVPIEDLTPFGVPGNSDGVARIYYRGGEFGDAGTISSWRTLMNNIIAKYEARDDKGIYGLGNNVHPNSLTWGHFSRGEYKLEKDRRNEELVNYTNAVAAAAAIGTVIAPGIGTLIGGFIGSATAGGPPIYSPGVDILYLAQTQIYGTDWKSQMVEELETLRNEIRNRKFERYFYQFDPERSLQTQTLEGIPVSTGQLFWVKDPSDIYQNWAGNIVQEEIDNHKAEYGKLSVLSNLEDRIRGY
jgi:hypothetical protein